MDSLITPLPHKLFYHVTSIVTNTYLKEVCNNNSFILIELRSKWFLRSSFNRLLLKNDQLHLTKFLKFVYNKVSLLFVSQLNSVLGKIHETPQERHCAYSNKSSFTDSAESSVRVRKSPKLNAQQIHKSATILKSHTRIEIRIKFNETRSTHNISKVSSKF